MSNFHTDRLMDIIQFNEIKPAVNQIEINPFHQQEESIAFMAEQNIQAEAWAPFAEGRNNLFKNELLQNIADKYSKIIGQVVLRWVVQKGVVALAKTVNKERMKENIDIFDFELNSEDMDKIARLETATSSFFSHRDPQMVKALSEYKVNI